MIKLVKIRLTYKALQEMNFPIYAGSTIRGIFGKSLRRVICLSKDTKCEQCAISASCPYTTIFENETIKLNANEKIPNPYIIEPMPMGQKIFHPNEYFSFEQIIIGNAVEKISYIFLAWFKINNLGFTVEKSKAVLTKIEQIDSDGSVTLLHNFEEPEAEVVPLNENFIIPQTKNVMGAKIYLDTPLRIQHQGHPVIPDNLIFRDFCISLLRRQQNLAKYQISDFPEIDFNKMLKLIDKVEIIAKDLHWFDWKRYSSRQKAQIALGGIMGSFTIKGDISELYPYLKMGEYFHLGKETVMGLGKFHIKKI